MHSLLTPPQVTHKACIKLIGSMPKWTPTWPRHSPAELVSLIEEKGYLMEGVLNANETSLFWKKMMTRTYISV